MCGGVIGWFRKHHTQYVYIYNTKATKKETPLKLNHKNINEISGFGKLIQIHVQFQTNIHIHTHNFDIKKVK